MAKPYMKIARCQWAQSLKGISIDIPRNELVVLTGLSGSGKSSLAFDNDSMPKGTGGGTWSPCRPMRVSFLGQMEKPDVESIEGLVAGDLHRPEIDEPESAFDGRHSDGDL